MSTALVLSAGGMYGAYQAGVWQELSAVFDPDIVVGASVGSLNAWHIACGCPADELAERWLHMGDVAQVRWRVPTSPWQGIVDASALENEIQTMCQCGTPVRRYGVVMTRIPSCRPTLFQGPNIGWQHLAASCSVPLFLRHHHIDGQWYSDGGLVDPLPLNAAVAMGAARIVTVNVMKHRPWPIRLAVGAVQRLTRYRNDIPAGIEVIEISPDSSLGPVRDSMYWQRDKVEGMIARGRWDARTKIPGIVQWGNRGIAEFGNLPYSSPA